MQTGLIIKIAVIVALILFLLLPLGMIDGVIAERSGYRFQVEQDIADTWTADQLLVGPVLSIPYSVNYKEKSWDKEHEKYRLVEQTRWQVGHFIAQRLAVDGDIATEQRSRGIYSVSIYTGSFTLGGHFSAKELADFRGEIEGFDQWGSPRLSLAIKDVRGIGINPKLLWNGMAASFEPGTAMPAMPDGIQAALPPLPASGEMSFALELELRGSRALQIVPVAKESTTQLRSTWPHPKFSGRFLPVEREITPQGFLAKWQTSSFSTNVEQRLATCLEGDCAPLRMSSFGVQFFDSIDIYQKITRATKYGILFILLTYVAFFLTETLVNKPLHPVQYVLVGFALCTFYLLLLSLAEHFGFTAAYAVATASSVLLIGAYLTGVLGKVRLGFAYATGMALLYGMLFVILRSEDFALLMGSALLFAMLAAVMLATRRVNWYEIGEKIEARLPAKRLRGSPDA